jgi:phage gpG-like protein
MIRLALKTKANTRSEFQKVYKRARSGGATSLIGAAALIRRVASRSIRRRGKKGNPSPAGRPPRTRFGQLRRAIQFAADKRRQVAIIGPSVKKVGQSGIAHEFGGRYKGQKYPKRPFMGPALESSKDKIPKMFSGSVK